MVTFNRSGDPASSTSRVSAASVRNGSSGTGRQCIRYRVIGYRVIDWFSWLGPSEVLTLIGSGGMGEVYRAHDQRLGRDVAVKVLPPTFSADPDRLTRFEQEARAAAALNHPNILAVYDVGQHAGGSFSWGAGIVFAITLAVVVATATRLREAEAASGNTVIRFSLSPPEGVILGNASPTASSIDVSPDGTMLAFVGQDTSGTALWLRSLDSVAARPLRGTEGAVGRPFWSPDSAALGFFSNGKLKRIDVATLTVRAIADAPFGITPNADGTWNAENIILFSGTGQPLFQVPAGGGERIAVSSSTSPRLDR
jgi:hypothetical protein